jgi:secretory carrier-associated membrane protein
MQLFFIIILSLAAGIVLDEKNWPPFFPIIHHDIANEIPIHSQRMQYLAFASYLGKISFLFPTPVSVFAFPPLMIFLQYWFQ